MELAHYLSFNAAILAALVSPGPAIIVMMRASLAGGRRAALRTGLGLACAAVFWSALAMAGLTALFAAVPAAYLTLKLLGAAYLIWLAIGIWRHAGRAPDAGLRRGLRGFAQGFAVNLSNPKAVLFIAAIFATLLPAQIAPADRAALLVNHFMLEAAFYALLAIAFTSAPVQRGYIAAKAGLDRLTAAVLGALALRLVS